MITAKLNKIPLLSIKPLVISYRKFGNLLTPLTVLANKTLTPFYTDIRPLISVNPLRNVSSRIVYGMAKPVIIFAIPK